MKGKNFKQQQEKQVDMNYKAFCKELPKILEKYQGKHALMRDSKIVDYFDTFEDAYKSGLNQFSDSLFSIQQVTDVPVNLGIFSYAVPVR